MSNIGPDLFGAGGGKLEERMCFPSVDTTDINNNITNINDLVLNVIEAQPDGFDSESIYFENGGLRAELLDYIIDELWILSEKMEINLDACSFHIYTAIDSILDYHFGVDFIVAMRLKQNRKGIKDDVLYTFGDFKSGLGNSRLFMKHEANWKEGKDVILWPAWEYDFTHGEYRYFGEQINLEQRAIRKEKILRNIANKFARNLLALCRRKYFRTASKHKFSRRRR